MNPLVCIQFAYWILAKMNNSSAIIGGCRSAEEIEKSLKMLGYVPYEGDLGLPLLSTWFRAPIVPGTKVVWMHDESEIEVVMQLGDRVIVKQSAGSDIHIDEDDFRMNVLLPVEVAALKKGMTVEEFVSTFLKNDG